MRIVCCIIVLCLLAHYDGVADRWQLGFYCDNL